MRRMARYVLVTVLALDLVVAVMMFAGIPFAISPALAQSDVPAEESEAPDGSEPEPVPSREALRLLGEQLAQRVAELERRESELEELLRGSEVLKRAGLLPEDEVQEPEAEAPDNHAFLSLQRAYENMEPDSAALAMAELAKRDKQAVIQLLLGWPPRTSGGILDALTQNDPALSADLSYEIWKSSRRE